MAKALLPAPHSAENDGCRHNTDERCEEPHEHRSPGSDGKRHVASEEECLAALSRLPALVALGMLTTAKANTIRSTYTAILQHYRQKRSTDDGSAVADDALVEILSRHPELANLLEPLLSTEQIASILAGAKDGSRGTS